MDHKRRRRSHHLDRPRHRRTRPKLRPTTRQGNHLPGSRPRTKPQRDPNRLGVRQHRPPPLTLDHPLTQTPHPTSHNTAPSHTNGRGPHHAPPTPHTTRTPHTKTTHHTPTHAGTHNMATSRTSLASHRQWRLAVLTRDRNAGITRCPICGVTMDYDHSRTPRSAEPDHLLPWAHGGRNTLDNGRTICRRCNQSRGKGNTRKAKRNETKKTTNLIKW